MSKLLIRSANKDLNIFGLGHKPVKNRNLNFKHEDPSSPINYNLESKCSIFEAKHEKTLDSDVESIILDLNKLGGLSSSSSLSWSDDYETETTKKVFDELKVLDRVLKGEIPIPLKCDKEEYEEWMDFFPNLSLFDNDLTPTNSVENLNKHSENCQQYDCDLHIEDKIAVMNLTSPKLFSNEGIQILSREVKSRSQKFLTKDHFFVTSKPKSLDVDQYLKVSPLVQNKRKHSSKSLLIREHSSESPDYSSLPHIKIDSLPPLKLQKSSQQIKKKPYSKAVVGKNTNHLILPPIENDYRSISAIPSENIKTLSALSVNSNFKEKFIKHKHCIGIIRNPVSSRKEKNNFLL